MEKFWTLVGVAAPVICVGWAAAEHNWFAAVGYVTCTLWAAAAALRRGA